MKKEKKKKEKKKKEKIRIKDRIKGKKVLQLRRKAPAKSGKAAAVAVKEAENDSFGAMIHSSEPIMKLKDVKTQAVWKKDLVLNLSCAVLLTTVAALFCMSIDSPDLIPFALTCPIVFMIIATIGSVKPGFARWIGVGVITIILMVTAIIWHSAIFDGIGTLINWFYDIAEEAQAYIYDRLPVGGSGAFGAGIAWLSAVLGLVAALPPVNMRRGVSALIAIAVMIAFAYYGLLPSAICIAVMIAALIAAVSRGSMLSFVPVVLAALLLFGAVMLVDPGENYGISRIDENLRDRFAFNSALIESGTSPFDEMDDEDLENDWDTEEDEESEEEGDTSEYAAFALYGFIILAVAALGAAGFFTYRRIKRKRALNRKGIDSNDAREAVTAMFPYTVKWLKGFGIEQKDPAFTSMEPALKREFSDIYSDRFMDMYRIWSEAAYSDHTVTEESRLLMEKFMKDTVNQVNEKCKFKDKLRLKLRYAL